jgi:hypothetical protein
MLLLLLVSQQKNLLICDAQLSVKVSEFTSQYPQALTLYTDSFMPFEAKQLSYFQLLYFFSFFFVRLLLQEIGRFARIGDMETKL